MADYKLSIFQIYMHLVVTFSITVGDISSLAS